MSRVFVTGDTHADWTRFSTKNFPIQKELNKEDIVIICGDFGIWHDTPQERYELDWLNDKPFTTVFVDGNHENFNRLYSDEFPIVTFHGAKAHQIRPSIYHIMRGEIMTVNDKKFFCFGGASSHDIDDGILDPSTFTSKEAFKKVYRAYKHANKMFRVKGVSWWPQEMPTNTEYTHGLEKLIEAGGEVDYIISHCAPQDICNFIGGGLYKPDKLTMWFNELASPTDGILFKHWWCGHYHINTSVWKNFTILYDKIDEIYM